MAERKKIADKWYSKPGDTKGLDGNDYAPYSRCEIRFKDGRVVAVNIPELRTDIAARALCHGVNQKLGDSYAGVEGNMDDGVNEAEGVRELLVTLGEWSEKKTAGPRVGDLFAAINRARAKAGMEARSEDWLRDFYINAAEAKQNRENARATPQIDVELTAIAAERATAKKVAAEAAAAQASTDTLANM